LLNKFEEEDEKMRSMFSRRVNHDEDLDFLFLFSDALVAKKNNFGVVHLNPIQIQIDYEKEEDRLKNIL